MRLCLIVLLLAGSLLAQSITGFWSAAGTVDDHQRTIFQRGLDNRPIARYFISTSGCLNATTNPGGYRVGGGSGTCIADTSNTAAFQSTLLARLDTTMNNMDAMDHPPRGLILWDMEGFQFPDTYIGHPSIVPLLTPEFDVIANSFFGALTARGYETGMTIRPNRIRIGLTLPPCHNQYPADGTWVHFKAMSLAYGSRAWLCNTSTQMWESVSGGTAQPSTQREGLEILSNEVAYSNARWGSTLYYCDSSIAGGSNLTQSIWRELRRRHPNAEFFPENWNSATQTCLYGRPYESISGALTLAAAGRIVPSMIIVGPGNYAGNEAAIAEFVAVGSVLVFDPNDSVQTTFVDATYAIAGY